MQNHSGLVNLAYFIKLWNDEMLTEWHICVQLGIGTEYHCCI